MTLRITKDSFIHNGQEYPFGDIQYTIHVPVHDKVIIVMNEVHLFEGVTIQSTHTSALMLAFARWVNNR